MLAMKYLNGVSKGDKRIVVCNGSVIATVLRKPKGNNWLCNLSMGGTFEMDVGVTNSELEIIEQMNSDLQKKGIFIYGLDTLYDEQQQKRVLSEINTSNVGGVLNADIAKMYVNNLIEYIKAKKKIVD